MYIYNIYIYINLYISCIYVFVLSCIYISQIKFSHLISNPSSCIENVNSYPYFSCYLFIFVFLYCISNCWLHPFFLRKGQAHEFRN